VTETTSSVAPPAVLEIRNGIAILSFNRAERMNVLGLEGDGDAVAKIVDQVQGNPSVRVLIMTGKGRAFSAGGDLRAMQSGSLSGPPHEVAAIYRRTVGTLVSAVEELDIPIIAAINGAAVGLGCGVACLADIRIAAENAKFAMSFVKLGLVAGDGSSQRLAQIIGKERAARMLFTGQPITAAQALDWGLVGSVVALDELMPTAMALGAEIAAQPPLAIKAAKALLRKTDAVDPATFREMSRFYQAILHQTADFREALDALVGRRDARFSGK
jgi:2-(1,2-epoxy-1,2-dihydrophenyl)acetyl-CoA isomerase